jgi:hypothetical protein
MKRNGVEQASGFGSSQDHGLIVYDERGAIYLATIDEW